MTDVFYAARGGILTTGSLYTLNPATGASTLVGAVGFGVTGLAIHPGTGVMYGITNNNSASNPRSLITVDPVTGAGTLVGGPFGLVTHAAPGHSNGDNLVIPDITFDAAGVLFGASANDLYLFTIDLTTGVATPVGDTTHGYGEQGAGIAFAADGTLWNFPGEDGDIQTLDPVTGAYLTITPLSGTRPFAGFTSAAFASDGTLYGLQFTTGASTDLCSVDPATGAITNIGSTGLTSFDALVCSPGPSFAVSGPILNLKFKAAT